MSLLKDLKPGCAKIFFTAYSTLVVQKFAVTPQVVIHVNRYTACTVMSFDAGVA